MITLLASALLTCSDAAWLIQGINKADLPVATRADLVLSIMEGTDPNCELTAALEAEPRR